jgi:cell cycle sensor histidine kinase DivJ
VPTAPRLCLAWLAAPILIVYYLHTGRYERAHLLSALALTALAALVALCTGGIGSFAAVWLVVVPVEAALSARAGSSRWPPVLR